MSGRDPLVDALDELVFLLKEVGEHSRSDWVVQRRSVIARDGKSPEAAAARREVRGVMAGMGSLSDIWLEPAPGSSLSLAEAERRRHILIETIDRLTSEQPSTPNP